MTQLYFLEKRNVFRLVVQKPENIKLVGYKGVFIQKTNENNCKK